MGCCSSQGAEKGAPQARTPFDTRPAETVQDVVWQARCQGPKTVHVTGRVVHTGSVFEAPFSGRHCVMVNVLVFLSGGQQPQQRTKPQPIYSGCNHLGFKIISTIDGRTQEIIIEPGVWEMHFERSSTFTNVRLDTQREMLVYKGTDSRTFQDLPKGKDFWDRFVHVTGPTKVDVPPVKDKSFKATSGVHFELFILVALCVLWVCLYLANRWVRRGSAKTASYQLPPLRVQLFGFSPLSSKRQQQPPLQQQPYSRGKDSSRESNPVTEQIIYSCAADFPKALELYGGLRDGKPGLEGISTHARGRMFTGLVMAALRAGLLETMVQLLHDARRTMGAESAHLFAYCIKLSASKRLCEHGLAIYKLYKWDRGSAMDEKTIWSSLIFCAVETKTYDLCPFFFNRVQSLGTPSAKDYGHMIRCKCATDGWKPAVELLKHMSASGLQGDTMIYNMVLAACVAAGEMEVASTILEKMERREDIADVITYNTLATGFSRAGDMDKCLQVYEGMRRKGFMPTQVTYGILLDGYINTGQVEKAAWVFEVMVQQGCPMNTVLLTTLMKGLAQAGRIDQAMEIYKRMLADGEAMPDLVTFSVLIKANCKTDRQDVAMSLFHAMKKAGVKPDAYIYNHLIAGCADLAKAQQARQLYQEMVASGVKPTSITLSVLIRVLERCRLLQEAIALLETEPLAHGIAVEARVYLQLLRAHLRERQGRYATRLYKMMLMRSSPTDDMTADILDCCAKMHLPETLADIVDIAREAGVRFNPKAAEAISRSSTRKQRPQQQPLQPQQQQP